ncbi:hypothetical protein RJ639_036115, partial [Escallonia herrerae]
ECLLYVTLWRSHKKLGILTIAVVLVFCITVVISAFVFHDHHHRKVFVGSIALVASVAMYGSPLIALKQVIQTKSVEFMPFYLSFFSFLASSLWMTYGLLSHDLFIVVFIENVPKPWQAPNLVGTPLGIFQLLLYCKYKKMLIMEKPHKSDIEKIDEKPKQDMHIVVTANSGET